MMIPWLVSCCSTDKFSMIWFTDNWKASIQKAVITNICNIVIRKEEIPTKILCCPSLSRTSEMLCWVGRRTGRTREGATSWGGAPPNPPGTRISEGALTPGLTGLSLVGEVLEPEDSCKEMWNSYIRIWELWFVITALVILYNKSPDLVRLNVCA